MFLPSHRQSEIGNIEKVSVTAIRVQERRFRSAAWQCAAAINIDQAILNG
jgi:hypothetical protein